MSVCSPTNTYPYGISRVHCSCSSYTAYNSKSIWSLLITWHNFDKSEPESPVGKAPPMVFVDIILEIGDMPLARSFVEESFLFSFEDAKYHNGRQCHS